VELPPDAFVSSPRPPDPLQDRWVLITICSLAYLTKGSDVLIDAVAACVRHGLDLHLVLVGDGRFRQQLEAQAGALGLAERVRFCGRLPSGEPVRRELDRADLFVLPSRAEGLPRSMIEAMARGLPCVGSLVGGVPELLPPEDMVRPDDAHALAGKIREVVSSPERLAAMGSRNLMKAKGYREEYLRHRREEFYRVLLSLTQEWGRALSIA
jgi:glycosyltransferase involved in cell wall biosynthesis